MPDSRKSAENAKQRSAGLDTDPGLGLDPDTDSVQVSDPAPDSDLDAWRFLCNSRGSCYCRAEPLVARRFMLWRDWCRQKYDVCVCVCDMYRTKGRYGDGHHGNEQQQQPAAAAVGDRFTFMSVLVLTQCLVSAAVARLGITIL